MTEPTLTVESALTASPSVRVDIGLLDANLRAMQSQCDAHGVELWPHIKTHKCVEIARRQLALGAKGLTCAKLGEAEALLPSGVKRIFWAHALSTTAALERARALREKLEDLVIAVSSLEHGRRLAHLLAKESRPWSVAIAIDSGLDREGLRSTGEIEQMRDLLAANPALKAVAIYTHEGHAYSTAPEACDALIRDIIFKLQQAQAILGKGLKLWPGCSVTAMRVAAQPGVNAVRPGAYVFGDLSLSDTTAVMRPEQVALSVRATVVDRPSPTLALIDAGSKTFSSDKTAKGIFAKPLSDPRRLAVTRVSEEHGFVTGEDVDSLKIGDVIDWMPAHVCPVMNLINNLVAVRPDGSAELWPVQGRGRND